MGCPIKMISRFFAAKVITNIVLKFGDNRLKGRGSRGSDWEKFGKKSNYAKTGRLIKMILRGFAGKVHYKHRFKMW